MTVLHTTSLPAGRGHLQVRTISLSDDLEMIWRWWSARHVQGKWSTGARLGEPADGQDNTIDDLRRYLAALLARVRTMGPAAPTLPVIGRLDGVDICYLEIYDVASSPLAAHPGLSPHDRGFHLMIGDPEYTGQGLAKVIGVSLIRWQFAEYPRAERVVIEPDARNARALRAAEGAVKTALERQGDVQLAHKVATVLSVERAVFGQLFGAKTPSPTPPRGDREHAAAPC